MRQLRPMDRWRIRMLVVLAWCAGLTLRAQLILVTSLLSALARRDSSATNVTFADMARLWGRTPAP